MMPHDAPKILKSLSLAIAWVVTEAICTLAAAWALDRRSTPLCITAVVVGGIVYLGGSRTYRRWIDRTAPMNFVPQFVFAGIGVAAVIVGCHVVQHASDGNDQGQAALGVALLFGGLLPVAHFIRTDMKALFDRARLGWWRHPLAWALNAIYIAAAIVPGLHALGVPLLGTLLVSAAWLASALVSRLGQLRLYRFAALGMAVSAFAILVYVQRTDLHGRSVHAAVGLVGFGIAVILGLIDGVSAHVRQSPSPSWLGAPRFAIAAIVLALGAAVAGVVFMHIRLGGAPASAQLIVMLSCLALGISFITRGQGFVVLALLGAVLVWTVQGRTASAPLNPVATGSTGTIVALGDSYIAGEGSQRFFPGTNVTGGNDCRRSPTAFPYLVAQRFSKTLVFDACSGALADQIWKTGQIPATNDGGLVGSLPQLKNPFPTKPPDLVLISIGGNDALFSDIGKGCTFPGSCTDLEDLFDTNLPSVGTAVTQALEQVAIGFPDSPIVLVPYPQMLSDTGCSAAPFNGAEMTYLHGFVQHLDDTLRSAVAAANAKSAEPHITYFGEGERAYAGQEVCAPTATVKALNTVTFAPTEAATVAERMLPTNWAHNSFHPTAAGHRLMAAALDSWLPVEHPETFGPGASTVVPPPAMATPAGAPSSAPAPRTCANRDTCEHQVREWMTRHALDAVRGVLVPALLLLVAAWILAALGLARIRARRTVATRAASWR